jgi:hypothetical protein
MMGLQRIGVARRRAKMQTCGGYVRALTLGVARSSLSRRDVISLGRAHPQPLMLSVARRERGDGGERKMLS